MIGAGSVATIAGFAVFALSPSPLVRSFGLLLVIGIALAFVVALTGGLAALGLSAWRGSKPAPGGGEADRPAGSAAARLESAGVAAIAMAIASPGGCWRPACCSRFAAGSRAPARGCRPTSGTSPPNLKALDDLNELEQETGISGDVNVTIRAQDPTSPAVISWAQGFQQRVLARHGFSGDSPSCADAQICPALS